MKIPFFELGINVVGKKEILSTFDGHIEGPALVLSYMSKQYLRAAILKFISVRNVEIDGSSVSNVPSLITVNPAEYLKTDKAQKEDAKNYEK